MDLDVSNSVTENASLIQFVMTKCGDPWLGCNSDLSNETIGAPVHGHPLQPGNGKILFETNNLLGGINSSSMVVCPESPVAVGFGRELQTYQGMLEQKSIKSYYTNSAGEGCGDVGQRIHHFNTAFIENSQLPWTPSTDPSTWEQDRPLTDTQLSIHMGMPQLNFLAQSNQSVFPSQKHRQDFFDGTVCSLHSERTILPTDQTLQDITLPVVSNHSIQKSSFIDSPHISALSKEVSDRDVKQEARADSSDCSDPMEDDEDKAIPQSGRRHLSKNLVAERKRRKKLNERLYTLRSLVPKITKMDRASILGDAIEYVKELQQQVKELQEEILEPKEDEMQLNPATSLREEGGQLVDEDGVNGICGGDEIRCSAKIDPVKATFDTNDKRIDDLNQPMQVEVSKMDGQIFSLRIFCEKRPGVFVKLMQALDVLGLDVMHANITTFRGLVLNVFNAEIRDKESVQAEQVKESLLEMTSQPESHSTCIIGEFPSENDLHPLTDI